MRVIGEDSVDLLLGELCLQPLDLRSAAFAGQGNVVQNDGGEWRRRPVGPDGIDGIVVDGDQRGPRLFAGGAKPLDLVDRLQARIVAEACTGREGSLQPALGWFLDEMARRERAGIHLFADLHGVAAVHEDRRFGGEHDLWMNGLYESLCIIVVFPLVVYLGASGEVKPGPSARICGFLGAISYPIYIIHYPFVYTYTAWVQDNKVAVAQGWPVAVATLAVCVLLAWICLTFYDVPVRQWLTTKYMRKAGGTAARPQPVHQ